MRQKLFNINTKWVLQLMAEQGLNTIILSEKAGISRNTLSCYLNGKREPILVTLTKIASALNVEISEIADFK